MAKIVCDSCGANAFIEKNGVLICTYCGARKRVFLENQISGLKQTEINMDADIKRLLTMCKTDCKNARRYANLILDIDPNNTEAKKYL